MGDIDAVVARARTPFSDDRIKTQVAMRNSGAFHNAPEITYGLVNSGAPLDLALKAYEGYATKAATTSAQKLNSIGYDSTQLPTSPTNPQPTGNPNPEPSGFWNFLGKSARWVNNALGGVPEAALGFLGQAGSVLTTPLQAGYASDSGFDKGLSDVEGAIHIPTPITSGLELVTRFGRGVYNLATGDLASGQKQDMQRAGYDPNSFASRYAYYYQSMGDKRSPVSEHQVDKLISEGFNQGDVAAAREIVVSGGLNNPETAYRTSWSPAAKAFYDKLRTRDDKANKLLGAMADSSFLTFGGKMIENAVGDDQKAGDWFGAGSTSRGIASAVADTIALWKVDPLAVAGGTVNNVIRARHTVRIDSAAEGMGAITQAMGAADDAGNATGAIAKNIRGAMEVADKVVTLNGTGRVEDAIEAGKTMDRYLTMRPSMRSTLDVLVGYRSGAIGGLKFANSAEEAGEAAADLAKKGARPVNARITMAGDGKPFWSFEGLDDLGKAKEQAKVADELTHFVWADAISSGRDILNSGLLMPGQLSLNGAVRRTLAPLGDLVMARNKNAMREMASAKFGTIKIDDGISTSLTGSWDEMLSPGSNQWLQKQNTFGLSKVFSGGRPGQNLWRLWEKDFSGKLIDPTDPRSGQAFGQLVNSFMPRRIAQMATVQYAAAGLAERHTMIRQFMDGMTKAFRFKTDPQSQRLVEQVSKGLIPSDEAIAGYRVGGHEHYGLPAVNDVQVGDNKVAAALYPYQLTNQYTLPNFGDIRKLVDRNKLMNALVGFNNAMNTDGWVRVWKQSKTANPANMMRQAIELHGFAWAANPKNLVGMVQARGALKAERLSLKADAVEISKIQNGVKNFSADELDTLNKLNGTDYATVLTKTLESHGLPKPTAQVLARLASTGDARRVINEGVFNVNAIVASPVIGFVRKVRTEVARRIGGERITASPFEKYLDDQLAKDFLDASNTHFGANVDQWAAIGPSSVVTRREDAFEASKRGFTYANMKITDARKWLTDQADINPMIWHNELTARLTDDLGGPIAKVVAQAVLQRYAGKTTVQTDIADQVFRMLRSGDEGLAMRSQAVRMKYLNGKAVASDADLDAAAAKTTEDLLADVVHHMGGKFENGTITFSREYDPLLTKIAKGKEVTVDDLGKFDVELRPAGMSAPLHAPIPNKNPLSADSLSSLGAKFYHVLVSRPLNNLAITPLFLAERRAAYDAVMPMMDHLVKKGMTQQQAAYHLEMLANSRAISKVFHATDEVADRTVFAALSDKYWMFQRANQDFLRRLWNTSVAHPEKVARAHLMMTAADHAGMFHYATETDADGSPQTHLTFTYPGTAQAQKVLVDAAAALGLAPDEVTRIPQFSGLQSQVRFINPGLANPTQLSLNPIFGFALTGMEKLFPEDTISIERVKRFTQGGDFEGTAGPISAQNLLPAVFSKFAPLMSMDDLDGQYGSALISAMKYAEAAGLSPGPDASESDRAKHMDAIKASTINILLLRAVLGTFLPATPQISDPKIAEQDAIARIQGLDSVRSEYYQIMGEMSKLYAGNPQQIASETMSAFMKRYPGQLIANPAAFSVGRTEIKGAKTSVPYTLEATQWLLDNNRFVRDNPLVATALLPASVKTGDYNNEAYKIQLKSDIRQTKSLEDLYDQISFSQDLNTYYNTVRVYNTEAKANPAAAKAIYAKMDEWEDGWRRTHPLASAQLDKQQDPNIVHAEVAPSLQRIVQGKNYLPASMQELKPAMAEMYQDYSNYRQAYMQISNFNAGQRAQLNKAYRQGGNQKWLGTPVEQVWRLLDVYEGA